MTTIRKEQYRMKRYDVIEPFRISVELVKKKLFRPFDARFYLRLAFIAWLAHLGQYGGCNFKYDFREDLNAIRGILRQERPAAETSPVLQAADRHADYQKITFEIRNGKDDAAPPEKTTERAGDAGTTATAGNAADAPEQAVPPPPERTCIRTGGVPPVLLAMLPLLVPVCLAILLLVFWLLSRGRFMFISALSDETRDLSIAAKWKESKTEGNSYFRYNLAFAFLFMLYCAIFTPLFFLLLKLLAPALQTQSAFVPLTFAVFLSVILAIPFLFLNGVFHEFGTLLMFRKKIKAWAAFRQTVALTRDNILPLLKYFIFVIAATLAVFFCLFICAVLTCCLCCIWLALVYLPFLWVLAFLPLLVLKQYFTMEFARQFGDDYNAYLHDEPEIPAGDTGEPVPAIPKAIQPEN